MLMSPEVRGIPRAALQFPPNLAIPLALSMLRHNFRDLADDAKEYTAHRGILVEGIEKIRTGPHYIFFNHPEVPPLLDGMFAFINAVFQDLHRRDLSIIMAELPFHLTMPWRDNLIIVPNNKNMKKNCPDLYRQRRGEVREEMVRRLKAGELVALAPEGKIGKENRISSLRYGAGEIAVTASKNNIPQIPVGICIDRKSVKVVVGDPFFVKTLTGQEAAAEMMVHLTELLSA